MHRAIDYDHYREKARRLRAEAKRAAFRRLFAWGPSPSSKPPALELTVMPLVKIAVPAHLPADRVHALANAVHNALVATCDVPTTDRFQLINRHDDAHRSIDPSFPDLQRSGDASIVEIALRAGRSPDQKRALYKRIVEDAATAGWRADDIMVALHENALIDWSFGGGIAQYAKA